jgi:hypothetical protein
LGHADLVTTEGYLRAADDSSPVVRNQVNGLYAKIVPGKPKLVA